MAKIAVKNIGIQELAVADLQAWDKNPRRHDIDRIVKSIETFGFRSPLVVNHKDGEYIVEAGHGRLEAAKRLGIIKLPCLVVEDDEQTAAAFAIADNRIQEFSEWDAAQLVEIMKGFDSEIMDAAGYSGDDLSKLISDLELQEKSVKVETFDADKAMAEALEQPTDIKPGQVYALGAHRLMCGDSTKREDAEKLMDGQKAGIVFTDPPYGIDYDTTRTGRSKKNWKPIEGDREGSDFVRSWMENIRACSAESAAYYICASDRKRSLFTDTLDELGIHWSVPIIWAKQSITISWDRYHPQHEVILFAGEGSKPNGTWYGPTNESTIWQIDRDNTREYEHPTQKPTALSERAVRNSSVLGDIVLDFFAGSGSTLIGADKTGRRAFVMELDPHYCQVIVDRWKTFTGGEPQLIEG